IQPANPQDIAVPSYNPQVVYTQPPPPPGPSTGAVVATGLLSFGLGVVVGAAASNNGCCWYGGSMAWGSRTRFIANNSFNRTWATRGYIPPAAPYYRAGGPYPAGRPPINSYANYNKVNRNNVNVNNVNVNNVNRNNSNRSNRNVNNSEINRNNLNKAN